MSNDVLVINPIRKSVKIMGEIRNPAKYELLEKEDFSDLLRFSSGFATNADKNKITLSRLAKNGERIFKNYPHDKISEIKLEDGDEIYIHKMPILREISLRFLEKLLQKDLSPSKKTFLYRR